MEAHVIAARLAAASEVSPIHQPDDWDSTARVNSDGGVITVVVRDHMGRLTRTYRAVVQLVSPDEPTTNTHETPPGDPAVDAAGGGSSIHTRTSTKEQIVTTVSDDATTWRDLTDQLIPSEVATLERAEQQWPDTDAKAGQLLDWARELIDQRRDQRLVDERLAHIPLPAGNPTTGGWLSVRPDDVIIRTLEWEAFQVEECSGVGAAVAGRQDEHGAIERYVLVSGDDKELTAGQARALAAVLNVAADILDGLERRQ